ncbi:MAG: hypothetical protein WCY09_06995 [Candidatus Omnitrophota bacterium]
MKQKRNLTFKSQINFKISGINIRLVSSDPAKSFLLNPSDKNFIRTCVRPDINIRIYYNNIPKIKFTRRNFLAQVDDWWSFHRVNGKKVFSLPRVEYRKRDFAVTHKKISITQGQPKITTSREPSDFNSRNTLLPLPRRLAIFDSDFKKGDIYIDIPKSSLRVPNPLEYPLMFLVLSELLHLEEGIILHACGVIKNNNQCYLFLGHSGDGKSTMANLWKKDAVVLNDDRVPIRKIGNNFFAYAIPGFNNQKSSADLTKGVKITGIFFLLKDNKNEIKRLNSMQSFAKLVAYTPAVAWDDVMFKKDINLLKQIAGIVPCSLLHFRPGNEIIEMLLKYR